MPNKKSEPQDEFFRLLAENESPSKIQKDSQKKLQQSELYERRPSGEVKPIIQGHSKQRTHDLKNI